MIGAVHVCYRLKDRPASLHWAMLIAITAWGCDIGLSSAPLPKPPSFFRDASIELSMGKCFGSCPEFSARLSGDGAVHWEGRRNVGVIGTRNGVVTAAAVQGVFAKLDVQYDLWVARARLKHCPEDIAPASAVCVLFGVPIDAPLTRLDVRDKGGIRVITHGYPPPLEVAPVEHELLGLVAAWLAK